MQRITLNTVDAIHIIQVRDIIYCKSNNSYTTLYFTKQQPIKASHSIKEVEKQLRKSGFIRTHQSYLVNPIHIVKVSKTDNYSILLSNKSKVPTSTRKRKTVLQILLKN